MSMPKAILLISTYNGEKFLPAMLDSVVAQTYENLDVYIRDDGSKDRTLDILDEYEKKYGNIHIIKGEENLGYPGCFYYLTDHAPEADYYFFADQDDVWFPDKVSRAVECLSKEGDGVLAYYAGYVVCDGNLKEVGRSPAVSKKIKFKDTIYEVCGLEFTMAINRNAMRLLNENKPTFSKARGIWMSMLFSGMGRVIYDNEPCAYYRRHEEAVTSSAQRGLGLWVWRIKKFFKGDGAKGYRDILTDFCQTVGPRLSKDDYKAIKLFSQRKYFPYAFMKTFYPKRLRRGLMEELALRVAFLINKF